MVKEQSIRYAQGIDIYQKVNDNFGIIERNIIELRKSLRANEK